MKMIAHLLCLIACLPALATTLEERRQEIANAPGVLTAIIQSDAQGEPLTAPVAALKTPDGVIDLFPGYVVARISYLYEDEASQSILDNTVAVIQNTATLETSWQTRPPLVLAVDTKPEPIDEAAAIIAAIQTTQSVKVVKYTITYYDGYADVDAAIESAGKLRDARYYVGNDDKGDLIVKPYDTAAAVSAEAVK